MAYNRSIRLFFLGHNGAPKGGGARGRKREGKKKNEKNNNIGGEEGERKKEPSEKSRKCVCSLWFLFPVEVFSFLPLPFAFFSPAKITLLSGIFDNARCEVKDFEHILCNGLMTTPL